MQVELKDVWKSYGRVQANAGVNLRLEPGRIYGLLGENGAGKSTLMRVLAGHTRPDRGHILINGRPTGYLTPARALAEGIGMLYQDPLDFPAMRVWENFMVGGRIGGRMEAIRRLILLAEGLQFNLPPDELTSELTVGERQQLEIVRLLDAGAKLLILDEPTTGISITQKTILFSTLKSLIKEGGRIIIVVTHKLADALELCHEIEIMRQGRLVDSFEPPYDEDQILNGMFGPELMAESDQVRPVPGPGAALDLSDARFVGEKFDLKGVSLRARPGEIIGLAGLEGNGQALMLRGLAGMARLAEGRMNFIGAEMRGRPYTRFRKAGIHFLPASRLEQGLFPDLSLTDHVCLAFPERKDTLPEYYEDVCVGRYQLKAAPSTPARNLSGGNQQRLLLSMIPAETNLLLMEHPTRGLDLGSARLVWSHLEERCRQGAILFFSSADLDEIAAHSHRVLVFYDRSLVADLPIEEATQERIGGFMAGRETAV